MASGIEGLIEGNGANTKLSSKRLSQDDVRSLLVWGGYVKKSKYVNSELLRRTSDTLFERFRYYLTSKSEALREYEDERSKVLYQPSIPLLDVINEIFDRAHQNMESYPNAMPYSTKRSKMPVKTAVTVTKDLLVRMREFQVRDTSKVASAIEQWIRQIEIVKSETARAFWQITGSPINDKWRDRELWRMVKYVDFLFEINPLIYKALVAMDSLRWPRRSSDSSSQPASSSSSSYNEDDSSTTNLLELKSALDDLKESITGLAGSADDVLTLDLLNEIIKSSTDIKELAETMKAAKYGTRKRLRDMINAVYGHDVHTIASSLEHLSVNERRQVFSHAVQTGNSEVAELVAPHL